MFVASFIGISPRRISTEISRHAKMGVDGQQKDDGKTMPPPSVVGGGIK